MSCCGCFAGLSSSQGNAGPQSETEIFEQTLVFISKVPLFQSMESEDYPRIAKAFVLKDYQDGSNVITQGEMGDAFFLVRKGKAKVIVDDKHVNTLGAGDFFGELALLHERPRNATITATEGNLQCSVISQKDFNALDLHKNLSFKRRNAMHLADKGGDDSRISAPKSRSERAFIIEAFMKNDDLSSVLKGLTEQELQDISNQAFNLDVKAGTDIIVQGDTQADLFYIVQKGSADAIKDGVKVRSYAAKGSFGGLALLHQAPRAATVRVTSNAKLWCIPRAALRAVFRQENKQKVAGYAKLLGKVVTFEGLSLQEKEIMADALMETTYSQGEEITVQGAKSQAFFMLAEGELALIENGKQIGTIKAKTGYDFPFFGDKSLHGDVPCLMTRKVLSTKAKFLVLERDIFDRVMTSAPPMSTRRKGYIEYELENLTSIGLLGCGAFGKVTLERYEPTGQHFAVKRLSKGFLLQMNQQKQVLNEKRIFRMTYSPFLVQCAATFNTAQHLLFLLEPALGGELFSIYKNHDFSGNEPLALFYSACVVKGFEHLHERCIVYRDMKPENLLLDARGYCKITDFGLSKFCIGKTFTTCGTTEYMPPEMVSGVGHNTAVDWWTLGILIFEMMTGSSPFAARHPQLVIMCMMDGIEKVTFPPIYENSEWAALVKELCKHDPSERLPVRPGGITNLEEDAWYKRHEFDWDSLSARQMTPPFIPEVQEGEISSNFEATDEEAPPEVKYIDPKTGWDYDFEDARGPRYFKDPTEASSSSVGSFLGFLSPR